MKKQLILIGAFASAAAFGCASDAPKISAQEPTGALQTVPTIKHDSKLIQKIMRIDWNPQAIKDTLAHKSLLKLSQRPDTVLEKLPLFHEGGINDTNRFLVPALAINNGLIQQIGPVVKHLTIQNSFEISSDGAYIASKSTADTLNIYAATTGTYLLTLRGHTSQISSYTFSPDNSHIATCSEDKTIRIWDVATGECLKILQGHTEKVRFVIFSPDGSRIASSSSDKTTRIWNVAKGKCIQTLQNHASDPEAIAFSPDNSQIVTDSLDHYCTLRIWDVATGQCLNTFGGHYGYIKSVAFSPNGSYIAFCTGHHQTVYVWDAVTGKYLHKFAGEDSPGAFSPDSSSIAFGSYNNTIHIRDIATGESLNTLYGHKHPIHLVAFSPDSSRIVSVDRSTMRIWDPTTGECPLIYKARACAYAIKSIRYSRDGSRIIYLSGDNLFFCLFDFTKELCHITDQQEQAFLLSAAIDWNKHQAHFVAPEHKEMHASLIARFAFLNDPRLFVV